MLYAIESVSTVLPLASACENTSGVTIKELPNVRKGLGSEKLNVLLKFVLNVALVLLARGAVTTTVGPDKTPPALRRPTLTFADTNGPAGGTEPSSVTVDVKKPCTFTWTALNMPRLESNCSRLCSLRPFSNRPAAGPAVMNPVCCEMVAA